MRYFVPKMEADYYGDQSHHFSKLFEIDFYSSVSQFLHIVKSLVKLPLFPSDNDI